MNFKTQMAQTENRSLAAAKRGTALPEGRGDCPLNGRDTLLETGPSLLFHF